MRQGMILLSYCRHHNKIDMLGKHRRNILVMLGKHRRNILVRGAVLKKNWLSPQECYNMDCSVGSYFFIIWKTRCATGYPQPKE